MLVDDHPMWRQTVAQMLSRRKIGRVVAEANDANEMLKRAEEQPADFVIMDMGLPGVDGAEATRQLLEHDPDLKVLVLSASDDEGDVIAAMRAGARGYLLKTAGPSEVADAVVRVQQGEIVLPPALADVVLRELREGEERTRAREITVVLGEAAALSREGLVRVLRDAGFDTVGAARDPRGLEQLITEQAPAVAVVATQMFATADDALTALERHPDVRFLLLSDEVDTELIEALSEATEAFAYLLKDHVTDVQQLTIAIIRLVDGESTVDTDVVGSLVAERRKDRSLAVLTDREREVLELMAEGRTNAAVGQALFLTPKTVEAHVRSIFVKLGLEPTADDHRRVLAVLAYLRSAS